MRDRLIELISQKQNWGQAYETGKNNAFTRNISNSELADHLLANGVVVPPCKVGDTIWWATATTDENCEEKPDILIGEVASFSVQKEGLWMYCRYADGLTFWHLIADYFGKTIFLTKEAAELALKERGGLCDR